MPAALRLACARLRAAADRSLASAARALNVWRANAPPAWSPGFEPLEGRLLFAAPLTAAWLGCGPALNECPACNGGALLIADAPGSQNNEGPEMGQDSSLAPIEYSSGQPEISATDIASSAIGSGFDQARSFSMSVTSGPLGNHWTALNMPYLIESTASDPNRPSGADETITVVESGVDQLWFDYFPSSGLWAQRDSGQDTLTPDTTTHLLTLTDTTGQTLQFNDFSSTSETNDVAGQFSGMTDAAGNVTTVTGASPTYDGEITQITRTAASGSEVEDWNYTYTSVGGASVISTVVLSRSSDGGTTFSDVQEADYSYYTDDSEAGGSTGDLQGVEVYDSSNLSDPVSMTDYRYWTSGQSVDGMTQPLGDIKSVFNTEDVARANAAGINIFTASDSAVAPYANNYYSYYSAADTPSGFADPPVYQETAAGFGGASTGGLGTFTFVYTDSYNTPGYNTWSQKTVESLPPGGTNTVYTNFEGGVVLDVQADSSGDQWATAYQYSSTGAQVLEAGPSAVTTTYVSGEPTILTDSTISPTATWYLNSTGLENTTTYASTTTATSTTAGDVAGYVSGTAVQQGYGGTAIPQTAQTYIAHTDADGNTVYQVASSSVFRNTDGTGAETTTYSYPMWFSGTNAVEEKITTLPAVTTAENGSGTASTEKQVFDTSGNVIWSMDADGYIDYYAYDAGTNAVIKQIINVITSDTPDFTGLPSGWATPSSGGQELITSYTVDDLGRDTEIISPAGNVTYIVRNDGYNSSTGVIGEQRVYPGFNASTGTTTGPIQVTREYLPSASGQVAYSETLTSSATPHLTGGVPDGTETLDSANIQSLTRDLTNNANQVTEEDQYASLAGVAYSESSPQLGTAGANFFATDYGYSGMGTQNHVVDPSGTITDTVVDGLGRPVATYVGTDDAGATDSDPTGGGTSGNNMIETESEQYDDGGIGDSDLTDVTDYPGGGAAARSTVYWYNWRDEVAAEKDGASSSESDGAGRPLYYYTLDNLDETAQIQQFDGDGVTLTTTDGVPVAPTSGLVADSTASYDELGQVYQTTVYPVTSGAAGTYGLSTEYYRDGRGDVIETINPGGEVDKSIFNGSGEDVADYVTDGAGGTSYAAASSVSGDHVLNQVFTTYDSDSNPVLTATYDRFSNVTSTGVLTSSDSRISYVAEYFDSSDRETASENVGTNGGSAWTRPTTPDASDDTHLVTSYGYLADNVQTVTLAGATGGTFTLSFNGHTTGSIAYNALASTVESDLAALTGVGSGNVAVTTVVHGTSVGPYVIRFMGSLAGEAQPAITAASSLTGSSPTISAVVSIPGGDAGLVQTTADPRGVVALSDYNMLGQAVTTIAGFSTGVPSSSADQTTEFTFDGDGDETSQTALMPAGTNSQTTDWVYAVSTGTGGSTIDSDNLLGQIRYPDASTGAASSSPSDDVTYTVDGLGENITMTDQNGTTHAYTYDTLGRETGDTVTSLGTGVDGTVRMLGFSYTPLGSVYQATTYANTSGTTVLTQDQFAYNGLGQETQEFQSNSGAVVTSGPTPTPSVQYAYAGPASGVNYSRPSSETYPDGRQIDTQYNSTLDSAISRPDAIADDSAPTLPLASYSYMGLSTIVQQLDGNNVGLSYLQQGGDTSAITSGPQYAGDPVTGLDSFGQVIDQNWVLNPTPASTPTPTPAPVSTDRTQLGYDRDGDVLYSNNLLNPSESELYHASSTASGDNNTAYDPLGREDAFLRGTLSSSGNNGSSLDTVANSGINTAANSDETFDLDAAGNWNSSTNAAGTGTSTAPTPVTTPRTNNSQNQVNTDGSATLGYDSDGDTTTDQNGALYTYDAWGHIATDINPTTGHQTTYTTDALGNRVAEQDTARTDEGPVLIVNNGSVQRSMVDSLTVVFPSAVTLASGAITLYNTTGSYTETTSYSNPSGDGKTWLVTFSGSDIVGNSLPNGVYNLTLTASDVSGISLGSNVTWAFHRLFGDINGDGTVDSVDQAALTQAFQSYDPAFDYNANGSMDNTDLGAFRRDNGTTYTYTAGPGPFLSGPSTTAPIGQTDISQWAGGANALYYDGSNVIEERQSGSAGAWRQEVWGLGYVNSLIEQDTATAVDSGGVLPTSHFLQYSLDTSFNGTGTLVGSSGSYDSVAVQNGNQMVVAGVSGSDLVVTRYNANGTPDTTFGTTGTIAISESSPTFAKLAIDSSGNIDVAVNSGSNVEVYQLSDTGSINWSTALTFATSVVPQGLAIDSSGRIVVAGDSSGGTGIYLARLSAAGAVDTTFGSGGYVNAPLSGNPSGLSLAFDSSGNILVAGSDSGDFSVVRFTSSGSLDTSFDSTGEVTVSLGGTDTAYAVAPGPGGTIVAAGVAVISGSNDDAVIRLTSSGALDSSFNSTGEILGSSGSGTIRAILVQTNGEVLAGGDAGSGTAQKVWMFTPAGAADTGFASGGTLTANSGATVYGWAVASGATQRIVVAGSYGGYEALAAFAPADVRLYAQQDANYNVTAMVDSNGNVVQRYVYDPYGNMTVLSAAWTPQSDLFNTQVGFQGMWLDAASGLYHTPNRDYSVALGRWIEEDPAGYVDGSNLLQALDDAPCVFADPLGLNSAAPSSSAADVANWVGASPGDRAAALISPSGLSPNQLKIPSPYDTPAGREYLERTWNRYHGVPPKMQFQSAPAPNWGGSPGGGAAGGATPGSEPPAGGAGGVGCDGTLSPWLDMAGRRRFRLSDKDWENRYRSLLKNQKNGISARKEAQNNDEWDGQKTEKSSIPIRNANKSAGRANNLNQDPAFDEEEDAQLPGGPAADILGPAEEELAIINANSAAGLTASQATLAVGGASLFVVGLLLAF